MTEVAIAVAGGDAMSVEVTTAAIVGRVTTAVATMVATMETTRGGNHGDAEVAMSVISTGVGRGAENKVCDIRDGRR